MKFLEELRKVYDMLSDDVSQHIYRNRILYLITRDDRYLDEIISLYLNFSDN